MANTNHWRKYHDEWWRIQPPLRPDADVVQAFQMLVGTTTAPVLLLGVTPELANAFQVVHAIDKSPTMIATVWPGDSASKSAQLGDWLQMPVPDAPYDGVVGDGSLSNVDFPRGVQEVLQRSVASLRRGGRFVCRVFERPEAPVGLDALLAAASEPARINFHAFKWQLAMHFAESTQATVPVQGILQLFDALFPDRDELSVRTGWPRQVIDTVEMYRNSDVAYTFMNRSEMLQVLPPGIAELRFDACGSYDLAACCPMLSFTRA